MKEACPSHGSFDGGCCPYCGWLPRQPETIPFIAEIPQRKLEREFWTETFYRAWEIGHIMVRDAASYADDSLGEWKKRFGEQNADAPKE